METIKAVLLHVSASMSPPDPQAQLRKCNALIRTNIRKLDRDVMSTKQVEAKTKNLIIQADRRAKRDPTRATQAQREARGFARELIRARRAGQRLVTSKAQLSSVQMQVNEAFAVRRIEGSIRASVGVMRNLNALIRLPELAVAAQELSRELVRAGVIEDMVGDVLPEELDAEEEDEEAEVEIDKILGEILKPRLQAAPPVSPELIPTVAVAPAQEVEGEEEEEDAEAMMHQMRHRLEGLRS